MHSFKLLTAAFLACGLNAAAAAAAEPARLESDPLDSLLALPPPSGPIATLGLEEAFRLSLRHHPEVRGAAWRIRAAAARRRDAGRWSNPTAVLEIENFGGELGSRRRETTASLGQPIELGGDRGARDGAARAVEALARTELTVEQRHVLVATAERFLDAWSLQERVVRLGRAERLAAQAIEAAGERFRAGAGPAVERTRAEVLEATRQAERIRTRAELGAARQRLASQWGGDEGDIDSLVLDPPPPQHLRDLEALRMRLERHPERLRAAAEVALEEARLREARAASVPDLQVSGGVRHLAEERAAGLTAGVSIPLPLWGTPRAGVAAVEADREAASAHELAIRLHLYDRLRDAHERYVATGEAYRVIADRVRPKAEEALQQISAGYRGGRFGSLELLEAQRGVLEADLAWVDATAEAWRARAALEHLLGEPLERIEEEGR